LSLFLEVVDTLLSFTDHTIFLFDIDSFLFNLLLKLVFSFSLELQLRLFDLRLPV
jgi:hypothetical protein